MNKRQVSSIQRVNVMNTALWIVQIALALVFVMTGGIKLVLPLDKIPEPMRTEGLSPRIMRIIGLLEVMGAVGVILPAWTGILPWLTSLAAAGLMLTMIGATFTNVRNKHFPMIAVNFILGVLAIIVIFGRVIAVSV